FEIRRADFGQLNRLVPEIERFLEPKPSIHEMRPVYDHSIRKASDRRPRHERLRIALTALQDAQATSDTWSPIEFERQIANVFRNIGVTVVEAPNQAERRDGRPDLALWIDGIQKDIGNPVAVEVKMHLSRGELNTVAERLSETLNSVGATTGIIVYGGPSMRLGDYVVKTAPFLVAFSVEEL